MSLLLEALKALAHRPASAESAATIAPGESSTANTVGAAPKISDESGTNSAGIPPETLLEQAASAVAESLSDDSFDKVDKEQEADRVFSNPTLTKTDESPANWAEVWQQALALPGSGTDAPAQLTAESERAADETHSVDGKEPVGDMASIFAPWFAAHGLANDSAEIADSNTELPASEIEIEEVGSAEPEAKTAEVTESPWQATAYLPSFAADHPVDPTWGLYDRSKDVTALWGQQPVSPASPEAPTVSENSESVEDGVIAAEVVSKQPPEPIVSAEIVPTASEASTASSRTFLERKSLKLDSRPDATSVPATHASPENAIRPSISTATQRPASAPLKPAQQYEEIRVSEPYLRLANRLLQSLRAARPQGIVLAAADETSAGTLDIAQFAKAISLSEEGKLLVVQAHDGRPDLGRRLGILPDQHPHWQGAGGNELSGSILCSSQGRIDLLPRETLSLGKDQVVDPLLIARCKRNYPLVLIDVGSVTSEIARCLAPQSDVALLVAVMQHTPREIAAQSTALLRRLGVRTAGCVLMEPLSGTSGKRKLVH